MNTLPRLATRVFNRAHWVTPHFAEIAAAVLAPRMGMTVNVINGPPSEIVQEPARNPMLTDSGILVIPVVGALAHRGDAFDAECGGLVSYTLIHNRIVKGLNDPDVRGILLDIDSPGGECGGCFELADTLLDARKEKPIYAVANAQACSAAFAIGSSASKFMITPSGEVGSIGVVWLHADLSKALQMAGVVTTFVYAGKHKIDGNPFEPLSEADKAMFQAEINQSYDQFVALVAARRPMSPEAIRATEARCYRAQEAVELGLVDGIASFQAALVAMEEDLSKARAPGITIKENDRMSQQTASPAVAAELVPFDDKAIRAEARAEGYAAGRKDATAIMSLEEAKGREGLASELAGDAAFDVEKAKGWLSKAPKVEASGGQLNKLMETHKAEVGAGGGEKADEMATRKAELQNLGKLAAGTAAKR